MLYTVSEHTTLHSPHARCFNHSLLILQSLFDFSHSFNAASQRHFFLSSYLDLKFSSHCTFAIARMLLSLALAISVASLTSGSVMRRQSPGFQAVPTTGKADNTFNNGAPMLAAEPNDTDIVPPAIYGARDIDLPFGRLFHGNAMFFPAGQLNTPTENSDKWYPEGADSANQSACGIPDNAYSISKVAIHPYFLKYADLSRKPTTAFRNGTRSLMDVF